MNHSLYFQFCKMIETASKPRIYGGEPNFEHPDALKIDRSFNRAFIAGIAIIAALAILINATATKPASNSSLSYAKITQYCGATTAGYNAGQGDDTNY